MTFRLGLLMAVVCIALSSCSKLFSPRGIGKIPDTDQTETLLKAHVFHLADSIGERNVYHPGSMERSARYIEQKLDGMGYAVTRQAVRIPPSGKFGAVKDWTAYNLIAIKKGTSPGPKCSSSARITIPKWAWTTGTTTVLPGLPAPERREPMTTLPA
ncbi:hypothetical protein [Akkermansia muciniphila]|uniref:hypothetical protein n=1 Tax=Akkermansia muciniphila TaxID=239935 RepID=UPI0021BD1F81|nr:hypothetical protein [Akkermansia muciniphila]